MKTLLFAALVISGVVAVGSAAAQHPGAPSLISPLAEQYSMAESNSSEAAMPVGVHHIVYNSALARSSLHQGAPVQMTLPDGTNLVFDFEKSTRNPSGSVTWVGQLAGSTLPYKAIITDDGEHVFGRIVTPEGEYLLRTSNGVQQLINTRDAGLEQLHSPDDAVVPPAPLLLPENQSVATSTASPESAGSTEMATVDVLLAYSKGFADELGSGLQTQLDQMIAVANQAYEDSEVYLRVRVVHSVELDYSDTESNRTALSDITPGGSTPPSVSVLPDLRDAYGADLVTFIRRNSPEHSSCGRAWILGAGYTGTLNGSDSAYSVVSSGMFVSEYTGLTHICEDLVLAHELGHNMGVHHDRYSAEGDPVFPYSYGYGDFWSEFGTVMSYTYDHLKLAVFSNPNIDCSGQPCGIAHPDPESADNARSLNNTRFEAAAFRATVVPESCTPADILTLENVSISGTVTEIACAIVAGPSYTVSSTANVAFLAIDSISFHSGFQVMIGAQFGATMDPGLVQ